MIMKVEGCVDTLDSIMIPHTMCCGGKGGAPGVGAAFGTTCCYHEDNGFQSSGFAWAEASCRKCRGGEDGCGPCVIIELADTERSWGWMIPSGS